MNKQAYTYNTGTYLWTITGFVNASQFDLNFNGTFINGFYYTAGYNDPAEMSADPTCLSGYRWSQLRFLAGTSQCGSTNITRNTNITLACGAGGVTGIVSASEGSTCQYQIGMTVNCSLNMAVPG